MNLQLSYSKNPEFQGIGQDFWTKQQFESNKEILDKIISGDIIIGQQNTWEIAKFIQEFTFQEFTQKKPASRELETHYFKEKSTKIEWMRTFHSLWISRKNNTKKEIEESDKIYVWWLWRKLLLPHEQYEHMNRDQVDLLIRPHLETATNLLKRFHEKLEIPGSMESAYYDSIHSLSSVYELLEKFYELSNEYRKKTKGKIIVKSEYDLPNLNMGMYEIVRILVMLKNILLWHQSPSSYTLKDDSHFLIRKLAHLSWESLSNSTIDTSDNPLYTATKSSILYWKKNANGTYNTQQKHAFQDHKITGSFKLEWMRIEGKRREWYKESTSIDLLHVNFRNNKNVDRWIIKRERKWLVSLDEILDKKGFQFVVSTQNEKEALIQILETELSTGKSGWLEVPEDVCNPNTDPSYHCIKWTLLIPHKIKKEKETLAASTKWINRQNKQKVKAAMKPILDRPPYNIAVEIQIFTLEEYIKAEHDKTCPANHTQYEENQEIGLIPMFYPKSIYGRDALLEALMAPTKRKAKQILNKIPKS